MESSISVVCKKCGDRIPLGTTVIKPSECIAGFEPQRITCPYCHEAFTYERNDVVFTALPEGGSCYEVE
jgi:hypothetical protein